MCRSPIVPPAARRSQIWIDQDACVGNGVCAELANEVFEFDGELAYVRDGERVLRERGSIGSVPQEYEDQVLDAAEECPAACIYIEDG